MQSGLEYWKTQYDYQKHLMTMDLLATAGFIALLGGFFNGSGPWGIACSLEYMKLNEVLDGSLLEMFLEDHDAIFIGNGLSSVLIVFIFAGFYISVISASQAAQLARSMIGLVHRIQTKEIKTENHNDIAPCKAKRFEKCFKQAKGFLVAALAVLLVFIASNLILYEVFINSSPKCI